ncbi:MAG: hypothetical protein ACTHK3_06700 [Solirubrobacterales bacterium]
MEEATAAMSHYPGMLSEMSLIYLIASFEAFMSDLLYVLFTARPEILKSSKHVTVAEVVDAESREALVVTEAHARRNLLVHRGGIADESYLRSVRGNAHQSGSRVESDAQYVKDVSGGLLELVDGLTDDITSRCFSLG